MLVYVKLDVLCFLMTPVLRFALLLYYRENLLSLANPAVLKNKTQDKFSVLFRDLKILANPSLSKIFSGTINKTILCSFYNTSVKKTASLSIPSKTS